MGLTDGRAPCKCMHGKPGVQGPPGPKVKKTCGSPDKQHRINYSCFMHPQGHRGLPGEPGDAGRQGNWVDINANHLSFMHLFNIFCHNL